MTSRKFYERSKARILIREISGTTVKEYVLRRMVYVTYAGKRGGNIVHAWMTFEGRRLDVYPVCPVNDTEFYSWCLTLDAEEHLMFLHTREQLASSRRVVSTSELPPPKKKAAQHGKTRTVHLFYGTRDELNYNLAGVCMGIARSLRREVSRRIYIYLTNKENVWVWSYQQFDEPTVLALGLIPEDTVFYRGIPTPRKLKEVL